MKIIWASIPSYCSALVCCHWNVAMLLQHCVVSSMLDSPSPRCWQGKIYCCIIWHQFNVCIGYYFKLFLFLIPTCLLFPYFIHTALYSPYSGINSLDKMTKCSHEFDTGSKQKTGFRRWTLRTMRWIVSTSHPRPGIVSDSYKTILTYNFILLPETTNPNFAS